MEMTVKKLIAVYDEKYTPDLSGLMAVAVEFKLESIRHDPSVEHKRVFRQGKGKTAKSELMTHYTPSGTFSFDQAQKWLTGVGYAKNTVYTALKITTKEGCIRNIGGSKYQFVKTALTSVGKTG